MYKLGRIIRNPSARCTYLEWSRDFPSGKIILENFHMNNRWDWFTLDEFKCKCGCDANKMELTFIDKLDFLRNKAGFPLIVSSGYRCPEYNNKVSNTGLAGPHTTGRAVDFLVSGERASRLLFHVFRQDTYSGIGINQKGDHAKRFIHLDDLQIGQRPWIWSY